MPRKYDSAKKNGWRLLAIVMREEERQAIHEAARKAGKSTRQFVIGAIKEAMERKNQTEAE